MEYPRLDEYSQEYVELRNDLDRLKSKQDEILDMMEQILDIVQKLKITDYERRKKTGGRTSQN